MSNQGDLNQTNSDNSGFTAPANAPGQAESHRSKAELDDWLGEQREQPTWRALYDQLLQERTEQGRPRWDWRTALYIAWRCVPPALREPRYEHDLATLLGLTNTRTIRQWREKDPQIDERIAALPRELLMDHVSAVMSALVTVASSPAPQAHPDRKLFLEMVGEYRTRSSVALMGEDDGPVVIKVVYDDRVPGEDAETA
jgi:hypothetical protein